jgi:endonuclease YncB( thermonuclease family)
LRRRAAIAHAGAAGLAALAAFPALDPPARAKDVRDVTPPGVTRIYRSGADTARLAREAGEIFGPIRVEADGTLRAPNAAITLYGLRIPHQRELCRSTSGARWTCGSRAIAALRNLIGDEPIACITKPDTQDGRVKVCWRGQTDISMWMLEEGWADIGSPAIEREYRDALALAKARKAGLWSDGRAP